MTKTSRSLENSASEVVELREMGQKLAADMRNLTGKVTTMKKLDQVVLELKEYSVNSGENRREKSPADKMIHPELAI